MERLAIFDIDGTLHKTHVMSQHAYAKVMKELGLEPPPLSLLFQTYGCGMEEILQILDIPPHLRSTFPGIIDEEEARQMHLQGECYPGIADCLRRLHEDGVRIGLCSMCSPQYMDAFLSAFSLGDLVDYRKNEGDGFPKGRILGDLLKEARADRAVMVGDRAFDCIAARENNIPCIGCRYGYAPEELGEATVQIERGEELYEAVMGLLG